MPHRRIDGQTDRQSDSLGSLTEPKMHRKSNGVLAEAQSLVFSLGFSWLIPDSLHVLRPLLGLGDQPLVLHAYGFSRG